MHFGNIDKTDFLIPPFALFYIYTIFAGAFNWPLVSTQKFFESDVVASIGVALCLGGLLILLVSLISFGKSFRVGIDVDNPDELHRGTAGQSFTRSFHDRQRWLTSCCSWLRR